MKAVNGSLWTIRPEIVCYLLLATILLARLHRSAVFFATMTIALLAVMTALSLSQSSGPWGMTFASQAKYLFYFVVGNLAYHLRYAIPFRTSLLFVAASISVFLLQYPGWEILAAFPLVYCTVFAGLVRLPMPGIFSWGDYSYGIYLFAYPIQQLVASFPSTRTWYLNILISLPITIVVAALSWHLVEKPALSLKRTVRIPAETEVNVLRSISIRFGIAICLIVYAVSVCAWADMFRVFGTRLHDHIVLTLVLSAIGASAVALSDRKKASA